MNAYLKTNLFKLHQLSESYTPETGITYKDSSGTYKPDDLYLIDDTRLMFFDIDLHPVPILHFHGKSKGSYPKTMNLILEGANLSRFPEDIGVLSVWTDPEKCILKKQCDKWGIPIVNALPHPVTTWNMPDKIEYYIEALSGLTQEIVLILDGYDTLIVYPEEILYEFFKSGKRVLFNATRFNYPNVEIDALPDRHKRGEHCYFNAGAAIGYREDLLRFYESCLKYKPLFDNEWGSEQYVVRHAFRDSSKDIVDFDWKRRIFITMGGSAVIQSSQTKYVII